MSTKSWPAWASSWGARTAVDDGGGGGDGNGETVLVLQDYQVAAVEKFLKSKRRGLLLWHEMGTGKTITALVATINALLRPEAGSSGTEPKSATGCLKRVFVLCPEEITFVWKREMAKVNASMALGGAASPLDASRVSYFSYSDKSLGELFDSCASSSSAAAETTMLVADEAHHLATYIRRSGAGKQGRVNCLRRFGRRLLLTGTPAYNDIKDFHLLINLCADSDVVPLLDERFEAAFYTRAWLRGALVGWTMPVLRWLTAGPTGSAVLPFVFWSTVGRPVGASAVEKLQTFAKYVKSMQNETAIAMMSSATKIPQNDIVDGLKSVLEVSERSKSFGVIYDSIQLVSRVLLVMWFLTKLSFLQHVKGDRYSSFSVSRFVRAVSPYVSVYNMGDAGLMSSFFSLQTSDYPMVTGSTRSVAYSAKQLSLMMELCMGIVTEKSVQTLNLERPDDVGMAMRALDFEAYKRNGVLIGNMGGLECPKFVELLRVARGRVVVYSSFEDNGVLAFRSFLDAKKETHMYMSYPMSAERQAEMMNAFSKSGSGSGSGSKRTFLLLHPRYSEGISIVGATQLHILEPIEHLSKKDQVVARVVRYRSHAHLPASERNVEVIEWMCTAREGVLGLKKWWAKIKVQMRHRPQAGPMHVEPAFDSVMSPDEFLVKEQKLLSAHETLIRKHLKRAQMFSGSSRDCCITYPSSKQEKSCLERRRNVRCVDKMQRRCTAHKSGAKSKSKSKSKSRSNKKTL